MLLLLFLTVVLSIHAIIGQKPPAPSECHRDQVIHRIAVYDNGAIEAECGPQPCGSSGQQCVTDQEACKDDTSLLAGLKWSSNGQRCVNDM
jgi:hypothetical protein